MGFWQTGYFEHRHDVTFGLPLGGFKPPEPPKFTCQHCKMDFSSAGDLENHTFRGHPRAIPMLYFKGRECGKSRVRITKRTFESDWKTINATSFEINDRLFSEEEFQKSLSAATNEYVDIRLANGDLSETFSFQFALPQEKDLIFVDEALEKFFSGMVLSKSTISNFVERAKPAKSGIYYIEGLQEYLFGVAQREGFLDTEDATSTSYVQRYAKAVNHLKDMDREPAEVICAIDGFQRNNFTKTAMRTKSPFVAKIARRFAHLMEGNVIPAKLVDSAKESNWERALLDSTTHELLTWCSTDLDNTADDDINMMESYLESPHVTKFDIIKLRVFLAERYLARGNVNLAAKHMKMLRNENTTETWLLNFEKRLNE